MKFNRIWEMPNSKTFKISCIRDLIVKYAKGKVLDPFANESSIKTYLNNCEYINNDLDTQYDTDYHLWKNLKRKRRRKKLKLIL